MRNIQFVPLRENHAAFNKVLKFANVSWPIGVNQGLHCDSLDRPNALLHAAGEARHKKVDQQWNVLAPFAKRRDLNREHVEAIEKILAELLAPGSWPEDRDASRQSAAR